MWRGWRGPRWDSIGGFGRLGCEDGRGTVHGDVDILGLEVRAFGACDLRRVAAWRKEKMQVRDRTLLASRLACLHTQRMAVRQFVALEPVQWHWGICRRSCISDSLASRRLCSLSGIHARSRSSRARANCCCKACVPAVHHGDALASRSSYQIWSRSSLGSLSSGDFTALYLPLDFDQYTRKLRVGYLTYTARSVVSMLEVPFEALEVSSKTALDKIREEYEVSGLRWNSLDGLLD